MAIQHFFRDLRLTSPNMRGSDVRILQEKLGKVHKTDGVYGTVTASAVKDWKWRIGLPEHQVNTTLRMGESEYLFGKQRSLLMQARTKSRLKKAEAAKNRAAVARSEMVRWANLGWREYPSGSNRVPQLETLSLKQGWPTNMGWPWCAFATTLSGLIAGLSASQAGRSGKYNTLYCPAILAEARAGRNHLRVVDWSQARDGDLVLFDWDDDGVADHIGRLNGDPDPGLIVDTVEGNTSYDNTGSQSNGGAVALRTRSKTDIVAVVRED